jgi:hypothetical protein
VHCALRSTAGSWGACAISGGDACALAWACPWACPFAAVSGGGRGTGVGRAAGFQPGTGDPFVACERGGADRVPFAFGIDGLGGAGAMPPFMAVEAVTTRGIDPPTGFASISGLAAGLGLSPVAGRAPSYGRECSRGLP